MAGQIEPPAATPEELRALSHPLSWRILRLCLDRAWTNQQLAERLDVAPATLLRRLRILTSTGFVVAEEPRRGPKGAWEHPYRATKKTWRLNLEPGSDRHLTAKVDLAILDAHRAEISENDPSVPQHTRRAVLRLDARDQAELNSRVDALLDEFAGREKSDQAPIAILWNAVERHEPPGLP
ncbi:ArsR family transcriptional regulator [Amycolatopsis sp. WAC 01375]|uniref:winged helix-turn-helix domain-containing protein n=1 Tax=Amycolatopsis sp. WAC 01375 TaxID=2203194 RepID=UPI000F788ACA|nr:winged helix-turn-helix domain-containing protein [Amycolatopsis sp. WAC 01375]RSM72941.1 ArsR family transcriptional regulator [Amycolatopsis sp. WAC 01375]